MIQTILIVIASIFTLVVVLCGFGIGAKRKAAAQLVKTCCVLISIVGAFLLAGFLLSRVGNEELSALLTQINPSVANDLIANPDALSAVRSLICMIAMPILFLLCWMLTGLVMLIPYHLIVGLGRLKGRGGAGSRIFGSLLGAVTGFLVILCIAVPFAGYTATVRTVVDAVADEQSLVQNTEELEKVRTQVDELADNPVTKTVNTLGGGFFRLLTTTDLEGEQVCLSDELSVWMVAYQDVCDLSKAFSDTQLDLLSLDSSALDTLAQDVAPSATLRILVSSIVSDAGTAWQNGEPYLGLSIEAPAGYENTYDAVISILANTTKDTISDDIHSIAKAIRAAQNLQKFTDSTLTPSDFVRPPKKESAQMIEDVLVNIDETNAPILEAAMTDLVESFLPTENAQYGEAATQFVSGILVTLAQSDMSADERLGEAEILTDLLITLTDTPNAPTQAIIDAVLQSDVISAVLTDQHYDEETGSWTDDPFGVADQLSASDKSEALAILSENYTEENAALIEGIIEMFRLNG